MHQPIPKFSDLKTHLLCSQIWNQSRESLMSMLPLCEWGSHRQADTWRILNTCRGGWIQLFNSPPNPKSKITSNPKSDLGEHTSSSNRCLFLCIFYFMNVWSACTYGHHICGWTSEGKKRTLLDPLELEFLMVLSHHIGAGNWTPQE